MEAKDSRSRISTLLIRQYLKALTGVNMVRSIFDATILIQRSNDYFSFKALFISRTMMIDDRD